MLTKEMLAGIASKARLTQESKGALFRPGVEDHAVRAALEVADQGVTQQVSIMTDIFADYRIKPSYVDAALTEMAQTNEGRAELNRLTRR